jgi:hypothetical protein
VYDIENVRIESCYHFELRAFRVSVGPWYDKLDSEMTESFVIEQFSYAFVKSRVSSSIRPISS